MEDIKKTARERGKKMGLTYAGALLPAEAHQLMQAGAKLVDVRTKPELAYVGKIPGSLAVECERTVRLGEVEVRTHLHWAVAGIGDDDVDRLAPGVQRHGPGPEDVFAWNHGRPIGSDRER